MYTKNNVYIYIPILAKNKQQTNKDVSLCIYIKTNVCVHTDDHKASSSGGRKNPNNL